VCRIFLTDKEAEEGAADVSSEPNCTASSRALFEEELYQTKGGLDALELKSEASTYSVITSVGSGPSEDAERRGMPFAICLADPVAANAAGSLVPNDDTNYQIPHTGMVQGTVPMPIHYAPLLVAALSTRTPAPPYVPGRYVRSS
jgi:hypothetical protein